MRSVRDIYRDYKIMPSLAEHQFRVAGVACAIMEAFDAAGNAASFHKDEVVSACLLHDMGNILKFDLPSLPEFLAPEGLAYWEAVKTEFAMKYGSDEHAATLAIAGEIGVSPRTMAYIDAVGFPNAEKTTQGASLEEKLCCYADQRVTPYGVTSIEGRFKEAARRYAGRSHRINDAGYAERQLAALMEMERQIFLRAAVAPDAITDAACEKYFPSLERFTLV